MGSGRKTKRGGRKSAAKAQTKNTPDEVPSVQLQHRAMLAAQRAVSLATSGFPSFDQLQARTGKFFARVEKKLEQVPVEQRQPPPATLTAPAALQYALLGEGSEVSDLREMFENLLAASMDSDTASGAHPAFVSIISQLTPDEARIMKSIDRNDYALVRVYELDHRGERRLVETQTFLGAGTDVDEDNLGRYISNLERLGILRTTDRSSTDIDTHNQMIAEIEAEGLGRGLYNEDGSIEVTPFGIQFLDVCVRDRSASATRAT